MMLHRREHGGKTVKKTDFKNILYAIMGKTLEPPLIYVLCPTCVFVIFKVGLSNSSLGFLKVL